MVKKDEDPKHHIYPFINSLELLLPFLPGLCDCLTRNIFIMTGTGLVVKKYEIPKRHIYPFISLASEFLAPNEPMPLIVLLFKSPCNAARSPTTAFKGIQTTTKTFR